jgi:hypothetical protein
LHSLSCSFLPIFFMTFKQAIIHKLLRRKLRFEQYEPRNKQEAKSTSKGNDATSSCLWSKVRIGQLGHKGHYYIEFGGNLLSLLLLFGSYSLWRSYLKQPYFLRQYLYWNLYLELYI